MNNKKNIYIFTTIFLLFIAIAFFYLTLPEKNIQIINNPVSSKVNIKSLPEDIKTEIKSKATLDVSGNSYEVLINEGDTVYEAMKSLQENKENNFSFKFKEYPALGIFIDEINGIKNDSGKYWIYSVNGEEASVGVSQYILKSGDIISWKQK